MTLKVFYIIFYILEEIEKYKDFHSVISNQKLKQGKKILCDKYGEKGFSIFKCLVIKDFSKPNLENLRDKLIDQLARIVYRKNKEIKNRALPYKTINEYEV